MKTSLRTDEAAAMLGVSRRTVYNMIRDGRLQVSLGTGLSSWRVTAASVEVQREERAERTPAAVAL